MLFFRWFQALKYIHSQNIVHLDLKPQNTIISDDLTIQIIDFGLSVDVKKNNEPIYGGRGTSRFMSPEMLTGKQLVLPCFTIHKYISVIPILQ